MGKFRFISDARSGKIEINADAMPLFLYKACEYNTEDPLGGLFLGEFFITVRFSDHLYVMLMHRITDSQSYFQQNSPRH
jgi:hypothetical protein